jgi:hypothetical protein
MYITNTTDTATVAHSSMASTTKGIACLTHSSFSRSEKPSAPFLCSLLSVRESIPKNYVSLELEKATLAANTTKNAGGRSWGPPSGVVYLEYLFPHMGGVAKHSCYFLVQLQTRW